MKKRKKKVMKKKVIMKIENENDDEIKLIHKILIILLILYGLYKLATTGGRGYDHFIGEPIEYRMEP
jgi:hypothetical protein